jgi:arginyl-tRNA synthetase
MISNILMDMNELDKIRQELDRKTKETREAVRKNRADRGYVELGLYPTSRLENEIKFHDIELEFIDRDQFGADIAVKSPALLKEKGSRAYMETDVPELIEIIKRSALTKEGIVTNVSSKGIYVNLKLSDKFIFETLTLVGQLGARYGESDVHEGENVVVDYSSPNVAKHLHAGHIRSTIVGHVISNIYEAAGYTAHRMNWINDWGGFGVFLEGYKRWSDRMKDFKTPNDFLYSIYLDYRRMEADAEMGEEKKKVFDEFSGAVAEQFRKLESGDPESVALWRRMVRWSLDEFDQFYDLLGIHQDYVVGESFYAKRGESLVEKGLKDGKVVIEDGAAVVPLGEADDKFVLRRADGSTIYSTRDLATIEHRVETFDPVTLSYVVGQEQTEHFSKLFATAEKLGICDRKKVALKHLALGHYIGAETKKKISSREGAQNVISLIDTTLEYFRKKYDGKSEFTDEEKESTARKLAIGSISFNDVRKDKKLPVEISSDLDKVLREFEESGGAYLMYASARARSILRKCDSPMPEIKDVVPEELEPAEINLIKMVNNYPRIVLQAAEFDNPAVVAGYLLDLAHGYNGYYENYQVMIDKKLAYPHRLVITGAVAQVIDNGLRLLHAEGPERI